MICFDHICFSPATPPIYSPLPYLPKFMFCVSKTLSLSKKNMKPKEQNKHKPVGKKYNKTK